MAPEYSKKDKNVGNCYPHDAGFHEPTEFPSVLSYNAPSAMAVAPSNILQSNMAPSPRNQAHQMRSLCDIKGVDHIPNPQKISGFAPSMESYNRDIRQPQPLQNNLKNSAATNLQSLYYSKGDSPSTSIRNSSLLYATTDSNQKTNFGRPGIGTLHNVENFAGAQSNAIPVLIRSDQTQKIHNISNPVKRMYQNIGSTQGFFDHGGIPQSHYLYHPMNESSLTRDSKPMVTPVDRKYVNQPNSLSYNSWRGDTVKSLKNNDQAKKQPNNPQLVHEYLDYLNRNTQKLHESHAQNFLSLKYPNRKDLANPSNSFLLNELTKIMLSTHKRSEALIPPPFNENFLSISQDYERLQNFQHGQNLSKDPDMMSGQRQNIMGNTEYISKPHSLNLSNSFQTSQNTTIMSSQNIQKHEITEPIIPHLVALNQIAGNHNISQRSPRHCMTIKPVQQRYNNLAKQFPYSVPRHVSGTSNTIHSQPQTHFDLIHDYQDILEDKTVKHSTNQPTQSNEQIREKDTIRTVSCKTQNPVVTGEFRTSIPVTDALGTKTGVRETNISVTDESRTQIPPTDTNKTLIPGSGSCGSHIPVTAPQETHITMSDTCVKQIPVNDILGNHIPLIDARGTQISKCNIAPSLRTRNINPDQVTAIVYEDEGIEISYQNSLNAKNKNQILGKILSANGGNALGLDSSSVKSQDQAQTASDIINIRPILPSTSPIDVKHELSANKPQEVDSKVSDIKMILEPALKTSLENSSPAAKPKVLNSMEKILPSPDIDPIGQKSPVYGNISVPMSLTNVQNSSECMSPTEPHVETDTHNSNVKRNTPENNANQVDNLENKCLEQDTLTEEQFLGGFRSLMCQLDSHNCRTSKLFDTLQGMIIKSTETSDSLAKIFTDN